MYGGLVSRKLSLSLSLCLFVCPSVCQTPALWRNGKIFVQIFIPYERSLSPVLRKEERLVRAIISTWNVGSTGARKSEITDFQSIFARSASAVASI